MIKRGILKISLKLSAAMAVLSAITIIILDVLKYSRVMDIPSIVFGYSSPLIIIQAAGVFGLIMHKSRDIHMDVTAPDAAADHAGRLNGIITRLGNISCQHGLRKAWI